MEELGQRLDGVGLNTQYWLPKLTDKLGITSAQALKHLSYTDYLKLECEVEHPWEKQALRTLLNIAESKATMKQLQEQRLEKLKKRQEQAKAELQELKEMQEKGRSRHEEAVRKKEEELQRAMDIAPEYWAPAEKPLKEVIENMHRQLDLLEESVSQSENLPDKEVLRRASGGLALQGIYKTNKLMEMVEKREQLIDIPEGFELFGPEQGPLFEKKEFSSAEAESTFTKAMEKLGFSISVTAKGGFGVFSAESSSDYSSSSESEKTHRSCSEHTYICTTKYSYLPLASCYFPKDQLRLSSAALQELKEIEDILSHTPEPDKLNLLKSRGGSFFNRFGSHVNQGPLHLGGIFWWKASSEGFRAEQLDEVKKQASDALSSYVGGSYGGFGCHAARSVNVSKSDSKTSLQGTDTKTFQPEIQLCITKTDGPPGVDSLTAWKSGLLASNKTWSVIDRGSQLIPVWDIILSNHRRDFNDVYQMGSSLTRAYEALTKLSASTFVGKELVSAVDEAKSFLEEMKTWEVTGDEEPLVTLLNFKEKLNEKTKHNRTWIDICLSDKVLQDFLENTVLLCKDLPAQKTMPTKSFLRCLLDPHVYSVKNFPKSSSIMQWIFHAEEKPQKSIRVSEFADFIQVLQEMKNYIQAVTHGPNSSPAAVEEAKEKVSLDVRLALCSLRKALQGREQIDIELLLLSIAASTGYCVENNIFQHLFGCPEINFMLKEMQKAHERYLILRDQDVSRAQAFLLLTGLTVTAAEFKDVSPEEKNKRLTFMKHHMGNSLSSEVINILKKQNECSDWEVLERNLNSLIKGLCEDTNENLQTQDMTKEVENVSQRTKPVELPKSEPKEVQYTDAKTHSSSETQEFLSLIKRLGLENYYPRKMGKADFHVVDLTSFQDNQPRTESELPIYFLQKLLMLDYRVRCLVCKNESKTKEGTNIPNTTANVNESLDILDDLFNNVSEEVSESATSQTHVHPMDIQMAIFHCADDFMRQYLSTKLSLCQFALPLLMPNPCTSQIEFPLWSFCQVKKKWKSDEKYDEETGVKKCKDKWVYQARTPLVSFIRLGTSSSSKSQILNTLLSKQKHKIFFHRHCRGSSKEGLLMKGVVEITWYCPGGKDDDSFDNCIAFTNLHGDAREHEQQVKFLQEIASVNVVLLSDADQNERGRKLLQDLLKSPKPFIFLCVDKERISVNRQEKRIKIAVKNRNEAELMDELTARIKCALEVSNTPYSLDACADIARQQGFLIDEDNPECREGKSLAQAVISILNEYKLVEGKAKFLPLQGELWHKWCKKDKELTRLHESENMGIEQHKSKTESEKRKIRCRQFRTAFPLNDLMRSMLDILQSNSETTKMYFLQWLKVFMDDLSSDHLADLHQKYHVLWSHMLEKRNTDDNELEKKLEELSNEINGSSLGLEHILREVGQIYEVLDAMNQKDKDYPALPQIAADLMVSGYPIELMDGDASYVPLKWIGAIFDKLTEKLGDKKVFVLSVLGIQSTGKSTLLNTMFGLQFNVSAGRCTRGAFMHLLKVDEEFRQKLNFDFVLIIDTEGLRAIELANRATLDRDNMLATFVIGVGNMTVINIFGENPSEMQDILQIVVQAFLRMKQIKLSPSCLFVHQNVGEITAKEKNMEGRRRLKQKLDEMAVTAAQQEFCDVTCFNDVIRFDVNNHIHYFAHLWEGDPPMAPPNPSYSQNVQELKSKILMAANENSQCSVLSMSQLKVRIQDLWRGLVNENFVFSFKNTLEIAVYHRLEAEYSKWTWALRSHTLDLQNKLSNRIKNEEISKIDSGFLEKPIDEKYTAVTKDLEKYFGEDKDSKILIQWKTNIEIRLQMFKQELVEKANRKGRELMCLKNHQSSLEKKRSTYKDDMLRRSKELALKYRDKKLNENELRKNFTCTWQKWVDEVCATVPPAEEPAIGTDVEKFLTSYFSSTNLLFKKIEKFSKCTAFCIEPTQHIQKKKTVWQWIASHEESDKQTLKTLQVVTDIITKLISQHIETKQPEIMNYSSSYFHEIVNKIYQAIDSELVNANFTVTPTYKLDLSFYLCQMAAKRFREMYKEFQLSNDPHMYLEREREDFFNCFKIACQGATSITTFADFLCNKLTQALRGATYDKTTIDIADEMRSNYPAFNGNRAKLETHILKSLAEEENFEKYNQYIQSPRDFFENFIKKCVDNYLDKEKGKVLSFLNSRLRFFCTSVHTAIDESTQAVKDKNGNASLWLDEFCNRLRGDLHFPRNELKSIEHQEIKDIEFLKKSMVEALNSVEENLKRDFAALDIEPFKSKPHEILFEQLCGCWKMCPFCKAVCTNTVSSHDRDHSVPFHRPQAVTGIQWYKTNHLVTDICSSLVASDCSLVLGDDSEIPYRNYRQAGPVHAKWSITPDNSAQSYWKWFVCHFRSQIEKEYSGKFEGRGSIPPEWADFTKEAVLSDLEKP
ncbi:interferon-induced very large GTPase 1-like [Mauremys mutica]|uniref:interferon-induced very large GTPase 1-like n=1 Tax=Mauremys mutica TaxID=74926 RepID=UPI001D165DAF|nr:interferon-induced very large GTPase 1-like [Mauremys mutica]